MASRILTEEEFETELGIRGFKVVNKSIGRPVYPCCEAYSAYLKQYEKEDTEENKEEFYKLIDSKDIKIEDCLVYRVRDIFYSIEHKTNTMGLVVDCLMDYQSPEEEYHCITPHV